VVWAGFQSAHDRRIGSEVLLHGTPTAVLDHSPPLDDAGDRNWPAVGRLPEGISHERACGGAFPITGHTLARGANWLNEAEYKIARNFDQLPVKPAI
jgi:hypothetical protein